mmetsp:Transcript_10916/g.17778  ORF Transcript_10916/g.17778 Transcript_10916/m.17778 type:complete len:179 (+) Transcript_10916:270-806(+)
MFPFELSIYQQRIDQNLQGKTMTLNAAVTNIILLVIFVAFFWLIPVMVIFDIGYNMCLNVEQVFPWTALRNSNDYVFIDVRTCAEYNWFRMADVTISNQPLMGPPGYTLTEYIDSIDKFIEKACIDDERAIVFICMSGHRSPLVANYMKRHSTYNSRKFYNLYGGMLFWKFFCGNVEY